MLLLKLYLLIVPVIMTYVIHYPAEVEVFCVMVSFFKGHRVAVLVTVLVKAILLSANSAKLALELLT